MNAFFLVLFGWCVGVFLTDIIRDTINDIRDNRRERKKAAARENPYWSVDEHETYTVVGLNGEKIRCFNNGGTDADPYLAHLVALDLNERT